MKYKSKPQRRWASQSAIKGKVGIRRQGPGITPWTWWTGTGHRDQPALGREWRLRLERRPCKSPPVVDTWYIGGK
ncbi:hypothetical protein HYQ46_009974 [Verticillium longisporum]|nr:hypothetical protein HYQ46_009974 [Verticillium longisporum]